MLCFVLSLQLKHSMPDEIESATMIAPTIPQGVNLDEIIRDFKLTGLLPHDLLNTMSRDYVMRLLNQKITRIMEENGK